MEQWREPSLKIRFKTRNGEFALVESGQQEIRGNFTGWRFPSMSLNRYFLHTNPRKINLSFGNCANYPPTPMPHAIWATLSKGCFFQGFIRLRNIFLFFQMIHKECWALFCWEIICKLRTVSTSPSLYNANPRSGLFNLPPFYCESILDRKIFLTNKPTSWPFNQPDHRQKDYM